MFKSLKKFFWGEESKQEEPVVQAPAPVVAPSFATPANIGEPVISFIKAFREQPRRFRIRHYQTSIHEQLRISRSVSPWLNAGRFVLTDRKTGKEFKAGLEWNYGDHLDMDLGGDNKGIQLLHMRVPKSTRVRMETDLGFNLTIREATYLFRTLNREYRQKGKERQLRIEEFRHRRRVQEAQEKAQAARDALKADFT